MNTVIYMIIQDHYGNPVAIMDNTHWNRLEATKTYSKKYGNLYMFVLYNPIFSDHYFDDFFDHLQDHITGLDGLFNNTALNTEYYNYFRGTLRIESRKRKFRSLRLL